MSKPADRIDIGALHGLRALMVLVVVNYHIWQQGWLPQYGHVLGLWVNADFITRSGYMFVDGMLLLSGFLLCLPYARQTVEGTPVPTLRAFYVGRVARIVPSYLFSVLVMLLVALPQGVYRNTGVAVADVAAHLTFTFNFWRFSYLDTPLNGALWTVAVEMQFYLIFPLLARWTQRKPALTLGGMALAGWGYRALVGLLAKDTAMLVNQMPAFLDVYALGMLGAIVYCRLRRLGGRRPVQACAVALFAGGVMCALAVLRAQASAGLSGHDALRLSQLTLRLPFALSMLCCLLGAAFLPRPLEWLLANRLMRFLAGISYNLYVWHQVLAVSMREAWFPDADALRSDLNLQRAYTVLCLSVSILAAMATTCGLERPLARKIKGNHQRREEIKP